MGSVAGQFAGTTGLMWPVDWFTFLYVSLTGVGDYLVKDRKSDGGYGMLVVAYWRMAGCEACDMSHG